jgi:hypothetical protein
MAGIMGAGVWILMVRRDDVRHPLESVNGSFCATFDDSSRCASGFGREREEMDLCLFRYAFAGVNNWWWYLFVGTRRCKKEKGDRAGGSGFQLSPVSERSGAWVCSRNCALFVALKPEHHKVTCEQSIKLSIKRGFCCY